MYPNMIPSFGPKVVHLLTIAAVTVMLLITGQPVASAHPPAGTWADVPLQDGSFAGFEAQLETIRQALKIPGMSAAVVQDQKMIWAAGFGYADLENQVAATPDTPYGLASVTKPVAAVLIMQLVEAGVVSLDAPVSQYGVNLGNDAIAVRHLLTHTSEGEPGAVHNYNGDRYAYLAGVIEGATGQTFATLLSENILLPTGMQNTALNPISNWGGLSLRGFDDIELALGWGADFQHYPQVYAHLAQPYQIDSRYNLIPGKYHLHHNPAAGLISSVTDLAQFDIALDQGKLLGESAKTEMFSPAYSTYQNRQDLMYGLGWYVQDFKGQRLLWHTGRWPPSTSALYLKVPDENLTFIVLANTDNLTVPFFGLGNGDVSKSLLALSFYRHFIFPEQHGFSPPMIDWEADERGLIQQLAGIEDKDAREFAERELWSFRQAYASVGRHDQAEKLRRVDIKAYPRSDFRRDDLFTQTAGSYPVITPALRAASFVSLIRGIALWFFLVFISIFWMAIRMLRAEQLSRWEKMLWLAATLFLGPVSILIQLFSHPRSASEPFTRRQLAWQASAFAITGYAVAWVLAVSLILSGFGQEPHPLMILAVTYLIPLLVGAFLIRIPRLQKPPAVGWGRLISQALLAEAITWNLGFAVFFSLTFFISNRLLTSLPHPTSPFFWAMLSVIAVPGVVSLLPLQYWMVQRGYSLPSSVTGDKLGSAALPEPGSTWPAFFITFVVSMAALAIAIGQFS